MGIEILRACKEGVGNAAGTSCGSHNVTFLQKPKTSLLLWSVRIVRLSSTFTVNLNLCGFACCRTALHIVTDSVTQCY